MVLCSSREIVSLRFKKKLVGPPVYYTGSSEPSHAPTFDWPDNTFKTTFITGLPFIYFIKHVLPGL